MKTTICTLVCALLTIGMTGCKKRTHTLVLDYPFYRDYGIRYNKTSNSTFVFAAIRRHSASGEFVSLLKDSIVLVNGLPGNTFGSTTDARKWSFNSLPDIQFSFKTMKETLHNHFQFSEIGDINFPAIVPDTFSLNQPLQFGWTGTTVTNSDIIRAGIETIPEPEPYSSQSGLLKEVVDSLISFTPSDMQGLKPGWHRLVLIKERTIKTDATVTDAGANLFVELKVEREIYLK